MTNPNDFAFCLNVGDSKSLGLTKREYFAAMAMQGLCAEPATSEITYENLVIRAVRLTDIFIVELNKEPKP